MMQLAAFQPDIPQNLGGLMRLTACLGVSLAIIEPCGFPLGDRGLRRAAMDYQDKSLTKRWQSWESFLENWPEGDRLILLSTRAEKVYHKLRFRKTDCLIVGQESKGVPSKVFKAADVCVKIPLKANLRTFNVVTAAAIVLGEALRQTGGLCDLQ